MTLPSRIGRDIKQLCIIAISGALTMSPIGISICILQSFQEQTIAVDPPLKVAEITRPSINTVPTAIVPSVVRPSINTVPTAIVPSVVRPSINTVPTAIVPSVVRP